MYLTATAPYVILVILFFRGVTLPGAKDGLVFYLVPSWERLADPKVQLLTSVICHLRKEKGIGAEMRPTIDSGLVTGDAPVRYWLNFFLVPRNNPKSPCET